MLSKLLKYDFKSVGRFGFPMVIMLAVEIFLGFGFGALTYKYFYDTFQRDDVIVGMGDTGVALLLVGFAISIIAACIGVHIVIIVDYYRSVATDEAYLTFTLPVSSKQILFSKLLNSIIWSLLIMVLVFAVIFSFVLGMIVTESVTLGDGLYEDSLDYEEATASEVLSNVLGVVMVAVGYVYEQLMVFMGVFLGAIIAKKHKVMASVGCMVGINAICSTLRSMGLISASAILLHDENVGVLDYLEAMTRSENIINAISIVIMALLCVAFFYITSALMEKKLNLP